MNRILAYLGMAFLLTVSANSQLPERDAPAEPQSKSASEILWSIQKLGTLGKALYVAAHPDDENTALISYLSLGGKYDTAYLSLTRGDGGQNLIGSELGDELGVIRTQELLAARRIDGGRQFFTRAKDFGFSKTADETLEIWERDEVLSDMVWVIRNFRPDVIITRFGPEGGFTHGHHTASCLLAMEAFDAAADPERFVEQLEWVEPWQAKRVVWNTSSWFFRRSGQSFDESAYVKLDVGGYDPLLGQSYNEIASLSRSQHRSQGFGARVDRGSRLEYFQLLKGEPMGESLFDGVVTDWTRLPAGEDIGRMVQLLGASFDPQEPAGSVARLLKLRERLGALEDLWAEQKLKEVDRIIAACLGLSLVATAPEPVALPGETLSVTLEVLNRSSVDVGLESAGLVGLGELQRLEQSLAQNQPVEAVLSARLDEDMRPSQPYWLAEEGSLGMFAVESQPWIGLPENPPAFAADVELRIQDVPVVFRVPVVYREVDPAYGEILRPVAKATAASVAFESQATLFPNYESRQARVRVSAPFAPVEGELELVLPGGWSAEPVRQTVERLERGGARSYVFEVTPPSASGEATLEAVLHSDRGAVYGRAITRIRYDHIPDQVIFHPSRTKAVSLEVQKRGERVAYLPGAGDAVRQAIEEIGYDVTTLQPNQIDDATLRSFDALVIGIRAYNTIDEIDRLMPVIFDYARSGGTVIVQYNTAQQLKTDRLAPYPLTLSRDRVTDETAEVRVLAPEHPALNQPNRIGPHDFEGWVQERGLYFPSEWDEAFTPLIAIADPGEPASSGSLLVARYGDGYFVYTGLSWFRQLPAGVPGAYRLFANLLSLGQEE